MAFTLLLHMRMGASMTQRHQLQGPQQCWFINNNKLTAHQCIFHIRCIHIRFCASPIAMACYSMLIESVLLLHESGPSWGGAPGSNSLNKHVHACRQVQPCATPGLADVDNWPLS